MKSNLEWAPIPPHIADKVAQILHKRGFKGYEKLDSGRVSQEPDGRIGKDGSESKPEAGEGPSGGEVRGEANYSQIGPQDGEIDLAAKLDAYDTAIWQCFAYADSTLGPIEKGHPLHDAIRDLEKFCFKKKNPRVGGQVYFLHDPARLAWFDLVKVSRGVRSGDPRWRAERLAELLGKQRDITAADINDSKGSC